MNLDYVKKRNGKKVEFKSEKIKNAVLKAAAAVKQSDPKIAAEITAEVLSYLKIFFKNGGTAEVEQIQDLVEKVLIEKGYAEIAKAYILYREQHSKLRDSKKLFADAVNIMDDYLDRSDWKVNENSNMSYSLQGLNNFIASEVTGQYWLQEIYPQEAAELHSSGDLHIHDLGNLSVYCCGWDLEDLLRTGFRGVPTKIESSPPKHLKTALGQIINFFYTLQGESSGAQAFSNFDTYLAPFIAYDGLNYEEVKQAMQEFLFNINVPTRVGFQSPFTNITMDLEVPGYLKDQAVIIGGQYQEKCYGEFQQEMDMLNRAFAELMMEGDAKGRMFSFPIPTYNITKDFEWENDKLDPVWEMTAKFGIPYFSNFINSDMDPEDARSMCLHPEENIFLKKDEQITKMTIGKLFEEYKGEKLDENWFFASSNIETLSLNPKTGELEWAKINKFLKTQGEQLITITAKDGKTMNVSADHPVAVYTKKGIETKKAKELDNSDFLIVMQDASKALKSEDDFSEELVWFMGLFVADGNYLYDSRYEEEVLRGIQISFNRQEKCLIEKTKKFVKDFLDYDMKFILDPRYDNSLRGYIYNSEFANIFKHDYKVRKYNRLPDWIWSASAETISSFIEGFFDGDGYEEGKEIHINDRKLAAELNLLIQLVGISTTIRYKKKSQVIRFQHVLGRGAYNNKVIKDSLHNLIPEFLVEQKVGKDELGKKRYQSYGCKMVGLSSVDRWDISNDKIEFLRNADFAVTEIKDIKINDLNYEQTFYDIELEKNHYFVHSGGNITHNCCRLRLDNKELRKRGGGLFGANPLTGCYDEQTEIMTEKGWKLFKNISKKDSVFTLSADNEIELHHPKKIFEYDWNGLMYRFESRSLDLLVTPNHRMVCDDANTGERIFVEAKNFNGNVHRIPKQGNWEGIEKENFVLPGIENSWIAGNYNSHCSYVKKDLEIQMDLWLKFFGIWLAEGSFDNEKIAPSHGYRVFITQKGEAKNKIKEILDDLPFNYNYDGKSFIICNKQLWNYLKKFGHCYDKYIPKKIKELSRRQLKILFNWMVMGDGHIRPLRRNRKIRQITYYTSSKKMAEDLQEIIVKIGYLASLFERNRGIVTFNNRKIKTKTQYVLGIQQSKHYRLRKKNIRLENYTGKVYCCEVENNSVLVRRNGKVTWCGNSIGVATLNMARIGHQAQTKEEFMERVYYLMDQAKESLEIKRKVLENLTEQGLYPYTKFYLRDIKKRFDQYWKNHFNTIGLNGMNEALLNFLGEDMSTPAGQQFSQEVMEKMREHLQQYQEETDNLYNLEATPAESTAYRFARLDREKFGNQIIAANQERVVKEEADPYYTNSTQLPVGLTDDIFTALELQDEIQSLYTGGTVFHGFLGEKIDSIKATKKLVKRIAENFKLPYYTLTPSFSICPVHGYLPGEHEYCPKCEAEVEAAENSSGGNINKSVAKKIKSANSETDLEDAAKNEVSDSFKSESEVN